jgi:hypothetical protein
MNDDAVPLLARIADALERLAPAAPAAPDFDAGRLFRHEPAAVVSYRLPTIRWPWTC